MAPWTRLKVDNYSLALNDLYLADPGNAAGPTAGEIAAARSAGAAEPPARVDGAEIHFDPVLGKEMLVLGTDQSDWINANGARQSTLSGAAGADAIYGSYYDDVIYGGADNDRLHGMYGNDLMLGGTGNDTMAGDWLNDTLHGGDGDDTMYGDLTGGSAHGDDSMTGGRGKDTMYGGGGHDYIDGGKDSDSISGGNGNDTIVGGYGSDTISGGIGRDTYVYQDVTDSVATGAPIDRLMDFDAGIDTIDLSKIDADSTTAGEQEFHYVEYDAGRQLAAGEMTWHYEPGEDKTIIEAATDTGADLRIELEGPVDLSVTDFVL